MPKHRTHKISPIIYALFWLPFFTYAQNTTAGLPLNFSFVEEGIKNLVLPAVGVYTQEYLIGYQGTDYRKEDKDYFGQGQQFALMVGGQLLTTSNQEAWHRDTSVANNSDIEPKESKRYFTSMSGEVVKIKKQPATESAFGLYAWVPMDMAGEYLPTTQDPFSPGEYVVVQFSTREKEGLSTRNISYRISKSQCYEEDGLYYCSGWSELPGLLGGFLVKPVTKYGELKLPIVGMLDVESSYFLPVF